MRGNKSEAHAPCGPDDEFDTADFLPDYSIRRVIRRSTGSWRSGTGWRGAR